MPNGNIVKWDFIKHQGAAAVVPVTRGWKAADGKAVPECIGQVYSGNPGRRSERAGRADDGGRCQGIRRRETGCHAGKMEWLITIRTTVAFCNEKLTFMWLDLTPGSQHLDEDEYINVEAYTVDELCEKILSGEIEDSKTISAGLRGYRAKYLCI